MDDLLANAFHSSFTSIAIHTLWEQVEKTIGGKQNPKVFLSILVPCANITEYKALC